MLKVTTETGSRYLFSDDMTKVTRGPVEHGEPLRRDGEWAKVIQYQTIEVGKPMVLILQGLSGFGVTFRKTSLVTDMVVQ